MQRYLVLDYETRSELDLTKFGGYEYANHPSTRIMCAAWAVGTAKELPTARVQCWSPAIPSPYGELVRALLDPEIKIIAHNAFFEQVITRFVLSREVHKSYLREIPHERWICTAARAAALALPRKLEQACTVLRLPVQKDKDGHKLMLKLSKPRKATKNNKAKWHNKLSDLKRVMEYCRTDISAEIGLFLATPPLHPDEERLWCLDQKINFRGFLADRPMVNRALQFIEEEIGNLNQETVRMTDGDLSSTTQRNGVLQWCKREGVLLPDLRAKTVEDCLTDYKTLPSNVRRMLEIRQAVSKTSTAKYKAFEMRSRSDGRVRDILMYHAASTGRWGGRGVQPHNFPRGISGLDTGVAADLLLESDLATFRLLFGDPMGILSSCLRAVIKAPPGRKFFCADYSAIEARVLFWLAKHTAGIKAFQEGRPIYEEQAQVIYRVKILALITELQRQVGKATVLGAGFGMGWKKFIETCAKNGIIVDEETAKKAIAAYRDTHYPVPRLWGNYERAAILAVKTPGKKFKINYVTWWVENSFLWAELPSGRRLAYFKPSVRVKLTPWGQEKEALYHWGQNSTTKQWERQSTWGGTLTENVTQAVARDILAFAMGTCERAGYEIVLTSHDEALAERHEEEGNVEEFENLMAILPPWAIGCPIKAKGWEGLRYKK